jgi:DNA-binding CsgD family transcriptional regulator
VKNHLHAIFARLDVSRRSEAAALAFGSGRGTRPSTPAEPT